MMDFIRARLPSRLEVLPVYGLAVFLVYSWSSLLFFWNLPRWLLYLSPGDIGAIGAYAFAIAFLDSGLIMLVALIAAFIFPRRWMRAGFDAKGGAFVLGLFVCSDFYQSVSANLFMLDNTRLLGLALLSCALIALLVYAVSRLPLIRRVSISLTEKTVVFLYLYLPLSAVSLLVVLARNVGLR
jgi:hypothetical protein